MYSKTDPVNELFSQAVAINERSYPWFRGHGTCSSFPTTVWVSRIAWPGAYQPERSYLARCRAGTHAHVHATARRHTLLSPVLAILAVAAAAAAACCLSFSSTSSPSPLLSLAATARCHSADRHRGITDNTVEKFQGEIEIDRRSAPKAAPTSNGFSRSDRSWENERNSYSTKFFFEGS